MFTLSGFSAALLNYVTRNMIVTLLEQNEAVQAVLSSNWKTRHFIPTWQGIHVWELLHKALPH